MSKSHCSHERGDDRKGYAGEGGYSKDEQLLVQCMFGNSWQWLRKSAYSHVSSPLCISLNKTSSAHSNSRPGCPKGAHQEGASVSWCNPGI